MKPGASTDGGALAARSGPALLDGPALPAWFRAAWTLACLALAAWLAVHDLAGVFLFGDEHYSLGNIGLSFGELLCTYDARGSGLVLPILQKACATLFGHHPLVYRLPAIVGALGTLLLVGPVARALCGSTSALLATAALATSSIHVFYSRYGRAYSLAACLALLYVLALVRVLGPERPRRRWLAAVVLAGGFLPAVHLTTGALALAVGLVALESARRLERLRALAGALATGAVLAVLLHVPAATGLIAFLGNTVQYEGLIAPFGALDVALLLAGSRTAAWVVLVALPLTAALLVRRKGALAALLVAGPMGLLAGVLASQPAGMSFAYARYLFAGWPFALMILCWAWVEGARRLPLTRARCDLLALTVGLVLLAGSWTIGPLGRSRVADERFANSNLALFPVPAFDEPWTAGSRIYHTLAAFDGPRRIVEYPALRNRTLLLYRNYWLQHGKDLALGFSGDAELARIESGPYVDLGQLTAPGALGADFVIVHHDIDNELANYWSFVEGEARRLHRGPHEEPLMAAYAYHGKPRNKEPVRLEFERNLSQRFGPPIYEDATVRVWSLAE